MASDYVTSSALKATLELSGETFADADISVALTAASRAIDAACDRRFWADADASQIRYYTPTDPGIVWIDDLVTLTELAVDSAGDGTYGTTWTENTDFILEPLNAAADGWPYTTVRVNWVQTSRYLPTQYLRSVRVTGKFGWAAVPSAIVEATTILAAKLLKRAREAPFGVVSTFGPDAAIATRISQSDPDVGLLLAPYQRQVYSF